MPPSFRVSTLGARSPLRPGDAGVARLIRRPRLLERDVHFFSRSGDVPHHHLQLAGDGRPRSDAGGTARARAKSARQGGSPGACATKNFAFGCAGGSRRRSGEQRSNRGNARRTALLASRLGVGARRPCPCSSKRPSRSAHAAYDSVASKTMGRIGAAVRRRSHAADVRATRGVDQFSGWPARITVCEPAARRAASRASRFPGAGPATRTAILLPRANRVWPTFSA